MSGTTNLQQFDSKIETFSEFIERFSVQNSDAIAKAGDDGLKKAVILIKCLPISTVTELQRKLKPAKLSASTYDTIVSKLTLQYEVKKSQIGASVRFINRKQAQGESIETYARSVNVLANECTYKQCCLDRLLRDAFVAGVRDTAILSALLQECDKNNEITFEEVVEKAKVVEQLKLDAQSIKGDSYVPQPINKVKKSGSKPPEDYKCIRCTKRGSHYANECFAIKLKCKLCTKTGHIAKACISKKIKNIQEYEEDEEGYAIEDERGSLIGHIKSETRVPPQSRANQKACSGRSGRASANGIRRNNSTAPGASVSTVSSATSAPVSSAKSAPASSASSALVSTASYQCDDSNCDCESFLL